MGRLQTLLVLLSAILFSASSRAQSTLNININNIRNTKGVCSIVLFSNASAFPGEYKAALKSATIRAAKGVARVQFDKIPPGTYAIAVIHDENEDGKLNTNFIGIPKEGYGASNNKLPLTSAPTFSGSSFTVASKDEWLDIDLKYF